MAAEGVPHGIAGGRFRNDARSLFDRKSLERLVLEPGHLATLVEIAHPSLERDEAAGAGVEKLRARRRGVDRMLGEAKAHQPPATGGMNTTESPAASLCDQEANSLFTATFNCSRERVKP